MNTSSRSIPGLVLAAAAAFALSFAPAASAQTAPEKKVATSKRNAAPAAATDPSPAPRVRESTRYPYYLGVAIGPSFEGATTFKLRLEGGMTLQPISRDVGLDLVLPLGFAFWGQDYGSPFGSYSVSYFRFELVPSARFTFPVAREFTLYADAGLGFAYYSVSVSSTTFPVSAASSGASGVFRLAGGGFYNLNDRWRLVLEPIGLNFYFGSGSGTAYSILFGVNYRF